MFSSFGYADGALESAVAAWFVDMGPVLFWLVGLALALAVMGVVLRVIQGQSHGDSDQVSGIQRGSGSSAGRPNVKRR